MKFKAVIPWLLLALSAALGVASWVLLPDTVMTQFSLGGSGATTMPKAAAILLPLALGAGGAVAALIGGADGAGRGKKILVSVVGIAVFALMLAVNL